ncbi:MAG: hypothetical protein K9K67_01530 [Bacteriovoracaceae bacterium]|nr:hypothetical protein [Bacteriovoracaceae bacterium]
MALSRFLLILISIVIVQAETMELPELTTKQDIKNIRYASSDGKFTYYQRNNGSLQFSTNYKVTEVIKLEPNTDYNLYVTNHKKYVFVEANETYHTYLAPRNNKALYLIDYGTSTIKKIGEGQITGIHDQDKWISYYNSFSKILTIQSPLSETLKHEIKLANVKNLYFQPQVIMIDTDTVIYTDINKDGLPGILRFKINSRKIDLLYKAENYTSKLEVCINGEDVYWGEFGLDPLTKRSQIRTLKTNNLDFKNSQVIYQSEENDLGQIVCELNDESIYFIKTFRNNIGKLTYDAFKVSPNSKKGEKISDLKFVTNLFLMDKKLLLPYQDKYYILEGKNNLTEFDKIKKEQIP